MAEETSCEVAVPHNHAPEDECGPGCPAVLQDALGDLGRHLAAVLESETDMARLLSRLLCANALLRQERDRLRAELAETSLCILANEERQRAVERDALADLAQERKARAAAEKKRDVLAEALEKADRWILAEAETQVRHCCPGIDRADAMRFPPHPEGLLWDHACGECIPGGPLVSATFRCAIHSARARVALAAAGKEPSNG